MKGTAWPAERLESLKTMHASGMTDHEMAPFFGTSWVAVAAQRRKLGIKKQARQIRSAPQGFAEQAPSMTVSECSRLWRSNEHTVRRWYKDLSITPKARWLPKPEVAPAVTSYRGPRRKAGRAGPPVPPVPQVDPTTEGQAAHHLRRYFVPVCKLRTIRPSAPAGIWVVGRLQVDGATLLQMAEAKGFSAHRLNYAVAA